MAYNLSSILQPVNDTGHGANPSVFKYGSTIPVKVEVTDCDGNTEQPRPEADDDRDKQHHTAGRERSRLHQRR